MRFILIVSLFLWSAFATAAQNCDYELIATNPTLQVTDTQQVLQQNYNISRPSKSKDKQCATYRAFFGKGLANNYQRRAYLPSNQSILYNLHSNINMNGILKDFNDATTAVEWLQKDVPTSNTTYTHAYFISVPDLATQNSPAAGIYTDNVQLSIYGYDQDKDSYDFDFVMTLTITLVVNKKIDISIVDEGASFDPNATTKVMDFGFIQQNQELGADLRVVSNTPYQVKLSSSNNSVLKHTLGESIDYTIKVNGTGVSLANSQSNPVAVGSGSVTTTAGDKYNLRVRITGDTSDKLSGLYQDIITVTAIAN